MKAGKDMNNEQQEETDSLTVLNSPLLSTFSGKHFHVVPSADGSTARCVQLYLSHRCCRLHLPAM